MSKKNHYSKLYLLFAPLRSLVKLIWQIFILFALSSFFGKDRDYLSKPHFWLFILLASLGILVALAAVVLIVGLGGEGTFTDNLIDTWNNIALTVQGWL